jgi:hypothetical protein
VGTAGASSLDFDLTDLQVRFFSFNGGAAQLRLSLPARVEGMLAEIEAGAARIDLRVPAGLGLRLRVESANSLEIDPSRFARREGGLYESSDYAAAKYRADVSIHGGANSIKVS